MTIARQIQLRIAAHDQQNKFIQCAEPEQLFGGSKSGGKSIGLCQKAVLLSMEFPGNRGLLCRKDFTDLRDSLLVTFFRVCPEELIQEHNQSARTITLLNGSTILYRGMGDLHEMEKLKGLELGWFAIDEASEVPEENYLMLRAQLRWVLPDGTRPFYCALLASNPEPCWLKRRFLDAPAPGTAFIPSLPKDNPGLPEGMVEQLRASHPAEWCRRYLDGDWGVSEGQVFQEFERAVHVINSVDYADMKLVAALDHATTGVTAMVVVAIDRDDNLFAVGEYYERNKLIVEHATAMLTFMASFKDAEGKPKKFQHILIDPSTEAKTLQGPYELFSVQDEYRRHGIQTIAPLRSQIHVGIDLIGQHLHLNPLHIHPFKQVRGSPSLFIVEKCTNLIREITELRKELTESGRLEYVGSDHALDCLRYIAMSRPKPQPEGMTKGDLAALPPQDQFFVRSHQQWGKQFDRRIARYASKATTWFGSQH